MQTVTKRDADYKYGLVFLVIAVSIFYIASRGRFSLILIWPGISFTAVAFAYAYVGVELFGKRHDGSRHWLATIVLWPYLLFARAVWTVQVLLSREPAFHLVNESLIVARRLKSHEVPDNVQWICDLTSELSDPISIRSLPGYRCYPILDAQGLPPNEIRAIVHSLRLSGSGRLLIHCANGFGRTGLVAAAWLIFNGYADSVEEALATLKRARRGIHLRDCQRQSLDDAIKSAQVDGRFLPPRTSV